MLVQNAGRRQRRHLARLLDASFAQLSLPWLAPAQLRWSASQAGVSSDPPPRLRKKRSPPSTPTPTQSRHLATATDQYTPRYPGQYPLPGYSGAFRNSQDQNVPWDAAENVHTRLSNLRPYDDPVILKPAQSAAQTVKVTHGIQGTALDLLEHLHVALQINRLDRAAAIIRRLRGICPHGSAELSHAHAVYLEECLKRLALHGRSDKGRAELQAMQKWFEVQIRNQGVVADARILVVMIRASIRALTGSQRERTVRRYTEIAEQLDEDQYFEVLESEDYDDNEFTILNHLVSQEAERDQNQTDESQVEAVEPAQYQRPDTVSLDELPEVLPTEQRGEGLANVKRSLEEFTKTPSLSADSAIDRQKEQAFRRQKILEETSVDVAIDRWRKADDELRRIGIYTTMQSRPIAALMWQWHQTLVPALEADLLECKKLLSKPGRADNDRYHYGPYLELLPLEKIAANTILYVLSRMNSGKNRQTGTYESEVKLTQLTLGLATSIEQECKAGSSKRGKAQASSRNLHRSKQSLAQSKVKKGGKKKASKSEQERQVLLAKLEWPVDAKVRLGVFLVTKLIESAQLPVTRQHPRTKEKVTQMQPAFLHRTKYERGRRVGLLSPNPALIEKIESEPLASVIAKRMPMVVQPKPWRGWNEGGYLHYSNPVVRLPIGDRSGKDYFLAAHKKGDTNQIYAGLTALGEVPWKIHHGVFKVQLEAWNSGEEIANFAPLHPTLDNPPEPDGSDPHARRRWLIEMSDLQNKRSGLHSKRCFQNFQLEIARTMVNETLYFPHNMDFRGRAYPIPPYLNHMGADNVRGLLVFAKGKELGPTGLRWLKIHLATVAGHDKASIAERVEFTMSHLDDIYDSVRNPLTGRRWWLQAEDAWQTLAACFELTDALDSPDPNKFVSHLPIQQDGTCNGLQHYAALGGDKVGAAQVNLEPSDRPADVYTAVAEAVKEEVRKDAVAGNPVAQKLDGRITRKCVKQPVMTNVYGVTWFGAKEQVHRQLEVLFPEVRKSDVANLDAMSQYVATKIFKSLGEMFAGAQAIQNWLGVCADRISTCITPQQVVELTDPLKAKEAATSPKKTRKSKKSEPAPENVNDATKKAGESEKSTKDVPTKGKVGTAASDVNQKKAAKPLFKSTVVWTTPLRLPVVQPYRIQASRRVQTSLQGISIHDPQVWHPVSKRKQLQAFPPNFIHSLDATHMLLSALKCKELGMTFASIHDSFWTHACDVGHLSRVLRDAFIEMHKDNIVGRLREEFQARYKGAMQLASVVATSPAGRQISKFRKQKKTKWLNELSVEVERLKLLQSDDAAERARGEAMVTPGSILESHGEDASLATPSEIENHQLGTIPESAEDGVTDVDPTETDADEVAAADRDGYAVLETGPDTGLDPVSSPSELSADAEEPRGKGKKPKVIERKLFIWRPLEFPPIPPKGSFDVRKIRESAYFFH